jgi:hypothetical protein
MELESLTKDNFFSAIESTYFPNHHQTINSKYWTSTAAAYNPGNAWFVCFGCTEYLGDIQNRVIFCSVCSAEVYVRISRLKLDNAGAAHDYIQAAYM